MEVTTQYRKNGKKGQITYDRLYVEDVTSKDLSHYFDKNSLHHSKGKKNPYETELMRRIGKYQYKRAIHGKKGESALNICCGFDIETTKIDNNKTFMYGWQFGFENTVIWGKTWQQFITFLDMLKTLLQGNDSQRLIVFVANLGYEWQFMKHYLNVTHSFFKEYREPVEIEHDGFIIFKECLSWGHSLSKLASDYCHIPKLKGDLDYSVYRESYEDFNTTREWAYIDFDVLILTQFARWFNDTYLSNGFKPVTITQALNKRIKDRQKTTGEETPKKTDFPKTYQAYDILMSCVYRGGYVHANESIVGRILHNIWSYDFTSSYPSVIETELYPWHFSECDPSMLNLVNYNFNDNEYTFFGLFEFTGIDSTTTHSIESKSKCLKLDGEVIDNGRVKSASKMCVWLTSLDYASYREFYKWDSVKCHKLFVSKLRKLPDYMIDEMNELYTAKAVLKKEHKNYSLEKSYVNTVYGLTVKRMVVQDYTLNGVEVVKENKDVNAEYDKYTSKSQLLPYWGVWVSAYARRNLLATVYRLETEVPNNKVVYCDTDSIKFTNPAGKKIINEYNERKQAQMEKICEERKLDLSIYWDLGSFDCEYSHGIQSFKTLGAKRYIHTYIEGQKKHYQATVAGLPKSEYIKRYSTNDDMYFWSFEDELTVKSCKLGSKYNDCEPFEITRLGKIETIPSCLTLVDCDFSMRLDADWVSMLMLWNDSKFEKRIL